MHIGFVEDTRLHGGTQIWVSEALRDFLSKGHEVTLLTPEDGFNAADAANTGARVVTYDFDAAVREEPETRRIWTEGLRGPDVAVCTVHPPRDGFHCSVFAARCIQDAGLPTVLLPKTGTIVPEYERRFYDPSDQIASRVISITDFTRRYLIDNYGIPEEQVALIYQGTDVAAFTSSANRRAEARGRYPVPESAFPVLASVGSFEERKGQVVLLEAMRKIRERLPNAYLLLVGDGPDEAMLRERATAMSLDDCTAFFPFTREPEYVFEVLDILVLSSVSKEGLPNVLLEALSMGRPVVSSRLAGVPEAVVEGETGLMVEPGNTGQLADAIVDLGSDAERCRQIGQNGRELMLEKFDKRRQFDAFLSFFAEVSGP